jgi:sugar fermentation stimulation protein A
MADCLLEDGSLVTAHCPNTGSMRSCFSDGCTIWLSKSADPKRKLAYTWELTANGDGFIGVNTARPNLVVEHGIRENLIHELSGYETIKREVAYGTNSRIDLLLSRENQRCYVEVKNTTLLNDHHVEFPDAVTERGLKHVHELEQVVRDGHRAVMFFLVNRSDGLAFRPAAAVDPKYAAALSSAAKNGVEILVYRCHQTLSGSRVGERVHLLM